MKSDFETDKENYDEFRAEMKSKPLWEIEHYQRMANAGIFHNWAVEAIEDELKARKK